VPDGTGISPVSVVVCRTVRCEHREHVKRRRLQAGRENSGYGWTSCWTSTGPRCGRVSTISPRTRRAQGWCRRKPCFSVCSKHVTYVEGVWFDQALTGRTEKQVGIATSPDRSFTLAKSDDIASTLATHQRRCDQSRVMLSALSLDYVVDGRGERTVWALYLQALRELARPPRGPRRHPARANTRRPRGTSSAPPPGRGADMVVACLSRFWTLLPAATVSIFWLKGPLGAAIVLDSELNTVTNSSSRTAPSPTRTQRATHTSGAGRRRDRARTLTKQRRWARVRPHCCLADRQSRCCGVTQPFLERIVNAPDVTFCGGADRRSMGSSELRPQPLLARRRSVQRTIPVPDQAQVAGDRARQGRARCVRAARRSGSSCT